MLLAQNFGKGMSSLIVLQLAASRMFDPPTYWRETRHVVYSLSRQTLIIVLQLNLISQHFSWNQTSHPESHRTDTDSRLLIRPGARWASWAALGSLVSKSYKVWDVNIRSPAGWRMVLVGNCKQFSLAGAPSASSDTFAAESTKAVKLRMGGFSQPG